MLLRNLDILSRMKWNICGLLLILSVTFCISVGRNTRNSCDKNPKKRSCSTPSQTSECENNGELHMFILGTDGFMGHMTGECINGTWSTQQCQSTILCNSSGPSVNPQLLSMTVFSFEENTTCRENTCTTNTSDYGVVLSRYSPYRLNISRDVIPTFVCLIEGKCRNDTLIDRISLGQGNQPNWTTEGCSTHIQGDKITCKCEHLTFFAVLMTPKQPIPQADLIALTYITYIGCGLSLFFLSIGLFMHFLMRKVKATDSLHVLINLFVALFLLNVAFLSNEYVARANNVTACRVMAGFMHYCLLSSFTWFAVEAFHLCLQMAKHSVTIKHYIIKISVVGWAPPALVVSIVYALGKYGEQTITTDKTNVTTSMCWILDSDVHYYVNIGYYCFIFIFTFSTFIVVLRWLSMLKLSRLNKVEKVHRSRTATLDITTILGLCCMLGLTWSFAFFGYGALRLPSYYIFTILNSSQGFFLFIYYLRASSLLGDSAASEESDMTEDTNTENPYEDLPTEDTKKAI